MSQATAKSDRAKMRLAVLTSLSLDGPSGATGLARRLRKDVTQIRPRLTELSRPSWGAGHKINRPKIEPTGEEAITKLRGWETVWRIIK